MHTKVLARYRFRSTLHAGSNDRASSSSTVTSTHTPTSPAVVAPNSEPLLLLPTYLTTFSSLNLFFGYPTIIYHRRLLGDSLSSVLELIHGRHRKRDLIKTLAFLFVVK
ncbi:hypothetical protein FRB94_001374 [Tulasnella sp. JGI-2019a]|nr:hypothetical protein FRB94_001374 [Tulasnella sp. JGI-2019a]